MEEDRDLCGDIAGGFEDRGRAVAQWLVADQYRLVVGATVTRLRMSWMGYRAVEFHSKAVLAVEHVVPPVASSTRSSSLAFGGRQSVGSLDVTQVPDFQQRMAAQLDVLRCGRQWGPPAHLRPYVHRAFKTLGGREPGTDSSRQPADRLVEIPGTLGQVDDSLFESALRRTFHRMPGQSASMAPMHPNSGDRARATRMRHSDMDNWTWSVY
ncbi:hypothetical protein I6A60_08725 [Frankia sp. AgB1.9]|uniref:hypothetical protein n=1 Tax=unclassified Frankia TaxID=2632575 RepID=UPI00193266F5|nr:MULTISPECIES: hypothetical protein [unclassified Frankia]MBL7487208.1 hypothetical protein [Frankia sp. AgW1.1]MBL7547954.1 hypothetical protein [Frankia sp. AgB1.9]MBL7623923.1 hypothetical protein [Frankia sp. AgB1.8]